jgi:WD40 repeat protein
VEEDGAELTEYEHRRQKNIEERKKLFHELKIGKAKEELQAVASDRKKTPQRKKSKTDALPPRSKSLRLQKKSPSGDPLPMKAEALYVAKSAVDVAISRKPPGPIPMRSTVGTNGEEGILTKIVDCCKPNLNQEYFSPQTEFSCELINFRRELSKLTLSPERIAKVVPQRIFSMAIHPTGNELLLAVGDKWGNLGLWNVLSDIGSESVQVFQPHVGPVNCTSFCTYNATKIYTTSHDGTVRCADLNKLVFDQIYASDENLSRNHTTWHCQVEESSLMIAHGNGKLALVDCRAEKQLQGWYSCYERSVRTVQMHPVQQQYFITSSALCEVKIWDRRYLSKKSPDPVCNLVHPKGLSSAFFSPAGKYVVTTCNDDRLRVYDVTNMLTTRPNVVASIKHNTHTGRWLTTFKAMWHPQRDDVIVVGSMEQPRGILLYGCQGERLYKLMDENLSSVCSICLFHPSRQIVFGGNSSGRVHVFM